MSKRSYPHISGKNKLPRAPLCCICGKVATWRIEIQVSWFRGDDEYREVCDEHKPVPAQQMLVGTGDA